MSAMHRLTGGAMGLLTPHRPDMPIPRLTPRRIVRLAAKPPRQNDFSFSTLQVEEITSLQNATVKHCVKLRTQRSYRESNQSVILSGSDLVRELAHVEFLILFHIKGTEPPTGAVASGARIVAVTETVMQKITGLESVGPATLAAEVELPELVDFESWDAGTLRRLLVLERCQDPGNLGTLLRSALALGWDGVFLLPGCSDHFNEKAMRASRGACFKLPVASGTLEDWQRVARYHGLACIAADLDRSDADFTREDRAIANKTLQGVRNGNNSNDLGALADARVSLVLGSEGQGLSAEVLEQCQAVSIPIFRNEMESLNVGAAGAILMWALSGNAGVLAGDLAHAVKAGNGEERFGKYLEDNQRPQWRPYYIDYKALKDLISGSEEEASKESLTAASPRQTSLSVIRQAGRHDTAEERFFRRLEAEVSKIGAFTAELVAQLRTRLNRLQYDVAKRDGGAGSTPGSSFSQQPPLRAQPDEKLLKEAKDIGDEFLALEKYVNLNYMGFHKILKKHDKRLPHTPCRQFYVAHLHNQPWVQGNYSDLMVILSNVFSQLRGDKLAEAQGGSSQAFKRSTTKYWIRTQDVSAVKRIIIENMPVFVFNQENYSGDAQLINSVYFDNESLELYHGRLDKKPGALALRVRWYGPNEPKLCFVERKTHRESWKGEKSVKERFTLPEDKVVPYIEGEYSKEQFTSDLMARGKSEEDARKAAVLFEEIQRSIESKQLKPFVRTQYMRSAFQMGHDRTVSFTLDTNLVMLKENPEGHPTCSLAGRWYRDPKLPIHRTEITRFPHAVLEIKLALPDGELPPDWVQDLMSSGLITEVHKMSKFIHGTAVLFPELVQAVPYWIDDESIRDSIGASAPAPAAVQPTARDARVEEMQERKPRRRGAPADGSHPLLGDTPTLALMRANGSTNEGGEGDVQEIDASWWNPFAQMFAKHRSPAASIPQRLEPKTFLASERTFMSWLHMAITLASIAAALLAFASTSHKSTKHMHKLSKNLVEFIALVLLPLAAFIVAYATLVFLWRNSQIALKQASYIDDRRGPLLLAGMVVSALGAIFIVSCADLLDEISRGGDAPSPAPTPSSPDPEPPTVQLLNMLGHLVLGGQGNGGNADSAAAAM